MKPIADRLWAKTDIKGPDDCWEWQGFRHPKGHGQIGRGRRAEGLTYTHIAAWEVENGPVPVGAFVCHRCDNPPCVNPRHLFLGTPADNTADMVAKRRHSHGLRHATKLTETDVIAVRRMLAGGSTQQSVADRFSVSRSMIGQIGRFNRWALTESEPEVADELKSRPLPGQNRTCGNGHTYEDVGVYLNGKSRVCKACQRERVARYMANGGREKKRQTAAAKRAST